MILQSQPSGADAWLVVAAPTSLLALPSGESARVPDLVARLSGPDGFRAALESLVGNGIAGAPPFALLDGDAVVLRVVLRGDVAVAAQVSATEVVFSGAGMATWTERVVEGAASLRLTVPGSAWTVLLEASPSAASAAPAASRAAAVVSATAPAAASLAAAVSATAPAENTWGPDTGPEQVLAVARPVIDEPRADPDSEAYDFLFGDTIYRTQAGVSIRIPNPDPERPGDHDGHTTLASDLGRPPAAPTAAAGPASEQAAESVSEATVLAPIPPHAQAPAPAQPAPAQPEPAELAPAQLEPAGPAPAGPGHATSLPLGPTLQLERADGSREPLNRTVLIGRSPAASGSGSEARLIAITDDPDISRTHLRVAVEGDAVVVTDLGSKNGSIITLPGGAPRKLRASEPTVVLPGTLIDLGGGTTFTVRED